MAGFFIMRKFIAIFFILITNGLLSQNNRVEAAIKYLQSKTDKELALALNDSSFEIRFREVDLALQFARYALPLAIKTSDKHLEATTLFNIGTAFHIIGTYDSALYYYQKSERFFLNSNDAKSIGTVYLQVASLFDDSGDEVKALSYNYKALNNFYKARDTSNIVGAMFNMAIYHSNPDSVFLYQSKGLKLLLAYNGIEQKVKALKLSIAYTNLGNTFQTQKKLNEAIYYFKLAIEQDELHDDLVYKLMSFENLGSCYQQMKESRKAVSILKKAIQLNQGVKGYRTSHNLYNTISYAYFDLGMKDSAYYYLREYTFLKDSVDNLDKQRILKEMQEKYDSGKKANEIELLNKDKQASESFRKVLYFVILLILIVVIVLIYSYVLKRKSNRSLLIKNDEINKQKEVIEQKQKEIIDSIRYAKRIQQSLMPTSKYISKKLDDLKK